MNTRRPTLAVLLLVLCFAPAGRAATPDPAVRANDPWTSAQVVRPAELAAQLASKTGEKPLLLHVGFQRLFREGGIPGSHYAGPGSQPEGLALLKREVKGVPKTRAIVVYCGCCPWGHCPNMAPAFRTLHDLGYKNVKALFITKNFTADWVDAGYPVDAPKR